MEDNDKTVKFSIIATLVILGSVIIGVLSYTGVGVQKAVSLKFSMNLSIGAYMEAFPEKVTAEGLVKSLSDTGFLTNIAENHPEEFSSEDVALLSRVDWKPEVAQKGDRLYVSFRSDEAWTTAEAARFQKLSARAVDLFLGFEE